MALPKSIEIVEVSARDGLQNEKQEIPTATKIALIDQLSESGLRHIEVSSFVSPKWVPQLADAREVFAGIKQKSRGYGISALVPNEQGMKAALECGVKTVAVFIAASEGFFEENINASIAESLVRLQPVFALAKQNKIDVRGYVSCVVGCPFDGEVLPAKVAEVSAQLYNMGCYEISLGDTIGVGTASSIKNMIAAVGAKVPVAKLAIHCHDTFGNAIDNIEAALNLGVTVVDSSAGGIGGCPYATAAGGKRAPGNVATESVLEFAMRHKIETGVDSAKIAVAGQFIRAAMGR